MSDPRQHPGDRRRCAVWPRGWDAYLVSGSNRGLRIDLLLASNPLAERCEETGIDYEIRSMEKPSDHAPVWAKFRV